MKVWVLAGLFTALMSPMAAASEDTIECQIDDTRRAEQTRMDAPPPQSPARAAATVRETAEQAPRQEVQRRRSGKRIPDAELIGPRLVL